MAPSVTCSTDSYWLSVGLVRILSPTSPNTASCRMCTYCTFRRTTGLHTNNHTPHFFSIWAPLTNPRIPPWWEVRPTFAPVCSHYLERLIVVVSACWMCPCCVLRCCCRFEILHAKEWVQWMHHSLSPHPIYWLLWAISMFPFALYLSSTLSNYYNCFFLYFAILFDCCFVFPSPSVCCLVVFDGFLVFSSLFALFLRWNSQMTFWNDFLTLA